MIIVIAIFKNIVTLKVVYIIIPNIYIIHILDIGERETKKCDNVDKQTLILIHTIRSQSMWKIQCDKKFCLSNNASDFSIPYSLLLILLLNFTLILVIHFSFNFKWPKIISTF